MSEVDLIVFKLRFLRSMLPAMFESDIQTFTEIGLHFLTTDLTTEDLKKLDVLYEKFEDWRDDDSTLSSPS